MDETSLLLPARSRSSSSSSSSSSSPPGPHVQPPDCRVLPDESGSSSSRVLEPEAQSRYRGLREIAILFRASLPGASLPPSLRHTSIHRSPKKKKKHNLYHLSCEKKKKKKKKNSSHIFLHPSALPPDRIGNRRREARFDGSVRLCLLSDVGICNWLVLAPFTVMNQVIPRICLPPPPFFFFFFCNVYRVVCCPRRLDGLGHFRISSVHRRELRESVHPFPTVLINPMVNLHPRRHHMGKRGANPHGPWSRRGAQPWYSTVLACATPRRTGLHRF